MADLPPTRPMQRILIILLSLLPLATFAQGLKSEENTTTNLMEMQVEAKFAKHFKHQHITLYLTEKIYSRLYESLYNESTKATSAASPYLRRSHTSLGLNYKPIPYFQTGAAYTLILHADKIAANSNLPDEFLRHRVTAHVTGMYDVEDWKFSLRERLDANIRTDSVNRHEKPQTALVLRHKLQAQYSIPGQPLKTYAYVELWNTLNQPVNYLNTYAGVDDDGNATAYAGKQFGQYLSEVRTQIGLSWRIDKLNTIGLAYRFRYSYNRDINITKSKGLIELTHARNFGHFIILSYNLNW